MWLPICILTEPLSILAFFIFFTEVKLIHSEMYKPYVYKLVSFDKYIYPFNKHCNQYVEHFHHPLEVPLWSSLTSIETQCSDLSHHRLIFAFSWTSYKWNLIAFMCGFFHSTKCCWYSTMLLHILAHWPIIPQLFTYCPTDGHWDCEF